MSTATQNKAPRYFQYPYISVVQNEFRNSYLQRGGSQANAAKAKLDIQQARVKLYHMFPDKKRKEDLHFLGSLNFSSSSSILHETLIESKT